MKNEKLFFARAHLSVSEPEKFPTMKFILPCPSTPFPRRHRKVQAVPKIYLDASIFRACFDSRLREDSLRLLEALRRGKALVLYGQITRLELDREPPNIRDLAAALPEDSLLDAPFNPEAKGLMDAYLRRIGEELGLSDEPAHMATAAVHGADYFLSWNIHFFQNSSFYNRINIESGYPFVVVHNTGDFLVKIGKGF